MIFGVKDINKSFATQKVLKDLSFNLKENDFLSIIGASGSGKTTLLSIIATLNKADSGKVYFNDIFLNNLDDESIALFRNKYFGFIFQSANMIPYLNVEENILLPLDYGVINHNLDKKELVKKLLKSVNLENFEKKIINQLSGGEQQRVAIARALVKDPSIIFADEPTGNLDAQNTILILNKLKEISGQKNKIVIVVTHDPMVSQYCNKTLKLKKL